MKKRLVFPAVVLILLPAALLMVSHHGTSGKLMVEAAGHFVRALDKVQKSHTVFKFDVAGRADWHYFPEGGFTQTYGYPRNGVTYKQMDPMQKHLANALLGTGLSWTGFVKAAQVMSLEEVIRVIEDDTTGHRDAEKFHYTIYGEPSMRGIWGWRVEGHHLSLHYTIQGGEVISSSPTFFGANPHEVAQGPHKGWRVLSQEEDLAVGLLDSLNAEQRGHAIFQDVAPYDIVTMADTRAKLDGKPQGLPGSAMTDEQYEGLLNLIAEYAGNLPAEVAERRMKTARETLRDKLFFAWAGRTDRPRPKPVPIGGQTTANREAKGNYYRVQSPSFLIEYDNTQNQSNHSHAVWRDFENDFGRDVLAHHHQMFDHSSGEHVARVHSVPHQRGAKADD